MASNLFGVEGLVCIAGPPQSGKSSLLFQQAVSGANKGHTTVFLSHQPLVRLPLLEKSSHNQLPLSQKTLSRILFKYPSSLSALQDLFDRSHLSDGLASHCSDKVDCVIIDNFHQYFTHMKSSGYEVTSALARTCAHIVDGLAFLSGPSGESGPAQQPTCFLSLTVQPHMNFNVIKRWFPSVLRISTNVPNRYTMEKQGQLLFSYNVQETYFEIS